MADCQIKNGFFVLRPCTSNAVSQCELCGRLVCDLHSMERYGKCICTDCAAMQDGEFKEENSSQNLFGSQITSQQEMNWAYNYRFHYYKRHHFGVKFDHLLFNDHDVRSFDSVNGIDTDDSNDEMGADLFDS